MLPDPAMAARHPAVAEFVIEQQQARIVALEAHRCIRPQCDPAKCRDCSCAINPTDEAAHVILALLNTLAVDDLGNPFEDGDHPVVDRARRWLQNRATALATTPQNPPLPAGFAFQEPQQWKE